MPGPVLDLGDISINKTDKNSCLLKLMEEGSREINKKWNV